MNNNISNKNLQISIVMAVYNGEKTIEKTINSILKQNFFYWELVIVDDGSVDKTLEIIKKLKDKRISIISQKNRGASSARNNGVKNAKSCLITFLDADDVWYHDYLSTIIELKKKYDSCKFFATAYDIKYENKNNLTKIDLPNKLKKNEHSLITDYFDISTYGEPPFFTSCIAVEKTLFLSIGGFPEEIKGGEDLITWARLSFETNFAYCSHPKAIYYMPAVLSRKIRTLPNEDPVAEILINLHKKYKENESLKNYIGHWFKIRASTYLSRGFNLSARDFTKKAINYSGKTLKLEIYYFISFIPAPFSGLLFRFFINSLKNLRILKSMIK